ncbi:hypothetical protein FNL56_26680 [Tardiphaga sp. vice304]|uniref:hypothetical protein n=1 Tax=Tardiphaga sp. vice304 TaxID=2592817 RepID=UPI0011653FB6|nr:hypothetical protein [Tardiphaga sp. vice304]QDM29306.1 hypothetical protein FNL56_26680 [Tardiphaga sp. vice304]
MDDFQLTTIIAKAIGTCAIEHQGDALTISSEQATCVAKVIITALAQTGMAIAPCKTAADPD